MKRTFDLIEQFTDIVIAQARPQTQGACGHFVGLLPFLVLEGLEPRSDRPVHRLFEGLTRPAHLQPQSVGDVLIEG